jgi:hypothetical protein
LSLTGIFSLVPQYAINDLVLYRLWRERFNVAVNARCVGVTRCAHNARGEEPVVVFLDV